jgi:hypothetical protein
MMRHLLIEKDMTRQELRKPSCVSTSTKLDDKKAAITTAARLMTACLIGALGKN